MKLISVLLLFVTFISCSKEVGINKRLNGNYTINNKNKGALEMFYEHGYQFNFEIKFFSKIRDCF